jgi:hypothetical protein
MDLLDRLGVSSFSSIPERTFVQPTTDARGFEHHVARWPLVPEHPASLLRPSILGGCFDRLALPTPAVVRRALPKLGIDVPSTPSPLVFLDTETTGLLGSGAFIFVFGIAWMDQHDLVVEQWTLRGVLAEDRMLNAALDRIRELGGTLASFNGSSFDLPLLKRRAKTHGIDVEFLDGPHLDLLHVSRRMWRGLHEDCRLVTLERTQLDVDRVDDIDGAMIPNTFWEALRNPDSPRSERRLAQVRMHNHADVVSLAALIPRLADAIDEPVGPLGALRAARHLADLGQLEDAAARIEPWLGCAGMAGPEEHPVALFGAELHRRRGSFDEAARVWRWVREQYPGDPTACDGLAKHLEHRERDFSGALAVAASSMTPCPRRLARLRRRARQGDV